MRKKIHPVPLAARFRAFAVLLLLVLAAVTGILVPDLLDAIDAVGRNVYKLTLGLERDNAIDDYLLGVAYAGGILLSIVFWPAPRGDKAHLLALWIVRCFVTLVFMLIYERVYSIDAFAYFSESIFTLPRYEFHLRDNYSVLVNAAWWVNHHLLPFPSYHAQKVIFSLVGFLGSYLLYRGSARFLAREEPVVLYAMNLVPSLLFWSSILGKDPVTYFGVCLVLYAVMSILRGWSLGSVLALAAGLGISYVVRPWLVFILCVPLGMFYVMRVRSTVVKVLAVAALPFLLSMATQGMMDFLGLGSTEEVVSATHAVSRSWSRGGSGQDVPEFKTGLDMIAFAPKGLFTALFRPLPGEILNPFGLIAGLENLLLLLLFVRGFRVNGLKAVFSNTFAVTMLSFILAWGLIYGFVSYQNLGAAVRFKLQILPAMVALALYLNWEEDPHVRHNGPG
ncbi:MAG: hypothetical protein HUU37_00660 [Bdellovibrionales bacterium]|nr:hypothetical protein [Bdellovibrionales bacterium]